MRRLPCVAPCFAALALAACHSRSSPNVAPDNQVQTTSATMPAPAPPPTIIVNPPAAPAPQVFVYVNGQPAAGSTDTPPAATDTNATVPTPTAYAIPSALPAPTAAPADTGQNANDTQNPNDTSGSVGAQSPAVYDVPGYARTAAVPPQRRGLPFTPAPGPQYGTASGTNVATPEPPATAAAPAQGAGGYTGVTGGAGYTGIGGGDGYTGIGGGDGFTGFGGGGSELAPTATPNAR